MRKNKFLIILFFIFTLTACQRQGSESDLERQIKKTKETIMAKHSHQSILPEKFNVEPVTYQAEKLRDPFESPTSVVRRASTQPMSPLNEFALSEIRFVGTISEGTQMIAIVMTPGDHTYKVKLGDQIGNQYGKIVKIDQNQIDVIETIQDEKNHPTQRTVVIRFKE